MRLVKRSPRELAFRLNQQISNAALWAFQDRVPRALCTSDLPLPEYAGWRDPAFEREIDDLARQILNHNIPLLGYQVATGREIEWRRDHIHGKVTALSYFRFVPYLDFDRAGDHKIIWELNRHQHLVVLAQAFLFSGDAQFLAEIQDQLESWWRQNPFLKGINWASALEVAFRALSWLWVDHLAGRHLEPGLRQRLWSRLYEHGLFLEHNLSTYFSPNTHLLGEGVALHALGLKLNAEAWRVQGERIVAEELHRQIQNDGSHFEQSTYYHLYAVDFFVLHFLLAGRPPSFREKLCKAARYLAAVAGPECLLTCFGDDDGGRLFHPYGARDRFARATLATCALLLPEENLPHQAEDLQEQAFWWLGAEACARARAGTARGKTTRFENSGLVSIVRDDVHILIDAGPFGFGGAGHSHADTLSLTARVNGREILIDPGTFTYVADPKLRDAFRGTGFHNTVRIDRLDQADPLHPFRWENKPAVSVRQWLEEGELAYLDAECGYRGVTHRRRFLVVGSQFLLVLDDISGPAGEHVIEQFWHLALQFEGIGFSDPGAVTSKEGLRSRVLGQKESSPVLKASWNKSFPHRAATVIWFRDSPPPASVTFAGSEVSLGNGITIGFSETGLPSISRT